MNQLSIDQVMDSLNLENPDQSTEDVSLTIPQDNRLSSVDPNLVYNKLNNLVETGDKILKTAQYLIDSAPDADNIASASSLIGSIKDVVHEFTVLHRDKLRFEQQKEIERFKAEQKEKLLKMRANLFSKNTTTIESESVDTVEFSQEQIIEKLVELEDAK